MQQATAKLTRTTIQKRMLSPSRSRPSQLRSGSRGGAKGGASSGVSHESLAARLPRSALESFLVRVLNGEAVGRAEVEAMLAGRQVRLRLRVFGGS